MKKTSLFHIAVLFLSPVCADVGDYAMEGWSGTAYVGDGWFAYSVKDSEDGTVRLDNYNSFLLSPEYASPIRKIAIKVKCSGSNPTRRLTVGVLVDGKEDAAEKVPVPAPAAADEYEIVKFTWERAKNVTAVRLYLESEGSPASGEWTLSRIYVFYGGETENEESAIEQIVNPLAAPRNLTVGDFTATSLELVADEVANAAGYRFSLRPFTESGRFEHIEPFVSAPEMSSGSGWTREAGENATFGTYTGAATTDGDLKALKIENGDVDFISPLCDGAIAEYSFMYRNGASDVAGKSNRLAVYGRRDVSSEWTEILPPFDFVADTSKHYLTNSVDSALGFRQLKISFTAGDNPSAAVSVDTLRVANPGARTYGEAVEQESLSPQCAFSPLNGGRYVFKVKALSDPESGHHADSEWSPVKEIDLAWADLELSAPGGVSVNVDGSSLKIEWAEVRGAEHYLVDVAASGTPAVSVVENARTSATSFTVEVPQTGEYVVKVTACGPYGKAVSPAAVAGAEVKPEAVSGLEVTAFPMHMLDNGVYRQSFESLSTVTKATDAEEIDLPYWQFYHADEPVEKVRFSALGGNPTAGGVYVCSDAAKSADSYGLGSLSSKESGCAYGFVMTNDRATAMNGFSVSFKARQRTFRAAEKSLAFEYLISSEAVTMASAGDWQALEIPVTAPKTESTSGELSEYVQDISVSAADIEVRPGEMIAFRWSDPAMANSPLVNIDDVSIACTFEPAPMLIKLK